MPPRTKSIFHLGEEESGDGMKKNSHENFVGLRILIQQAGRRPNIVVNPAVRLAAARPRRSDEKSSYESEFSKACCFCKKELSLHKEVYMYRGDQGFCSIECRWQQILLDEGREMEAAMLRRPHRRRAPDGRKRILAAA